MRLHLDLCPGFRHLGAMTRGSKTLSLRRILTLAGTVLSTAVSAVADDKTPPALTPGEIGRVSSIVDGDTLFLDSGLKVRLSASQAPKLPLGRKGFKAWPLGQEAKAALTQRALGKTVRLYYGGLERDRYDRALAQVYLWDGEKPGDWLQEEMIRAGMARVYTWPDTFQDSERLYAAERDARADKRGIWANPYYAVRTPEPNSLAQDTDSFQVIEGLITSAAKVRDRIYLNFGADYKTDFTVGIDRDALKRFKKDGIDPLSLEGARVRVRGWIELENGPAIWLDDPHRLEILE